jgi:hypothetical protein
MGLLVRAYVSEPIREAIEKLRATGIRIDYRPDEEDLAKTGFFFRNGGTIYNYDIIRKSGHEIPELNVSASALTGVELVTTSSLCTFLLRRIHDTLSVVQWPAEYEPSSLPTEEPIPTMEDVISFGRNASFVFQMFGVSKESYAEYLRRVKALGELICQELSVSRSEALALPRQTKLPSKSAAGFLDLEAWLVQS